MVFINEQVQHDCLSGWHVAEVLSVTAEESIEI
jgi:hypothetical protein